MENQQAQLQKSTSRKRLLTRSVFGIISVALVLIGTMKFTGTSSSRQSSPAAIKAQEEFQRKLVTAEDECQQKVEAARKEAEQIK